MTQGVFTIIRSKSDVDYKMKFMRDKFMDWDYSTPMAIKFEPYRHARSLSQNALFHKWCRQISARFIQKHSEYTPELIKIYLKKQFLGLEDIKIGKQVIKDQIKHTSQLNVGEMAHFMDKCYHWARDQDILLSVPEESEYRKVKKLQER